MESPTKGSTHTRAVSLWFVASMLVAGIAGQAIWVLLQLAATSNPTESPWFSSLVWLQVLPWCGWLCLVARTRWLRGTLLVAAFAGSVLVIGLTSLKVTEIRGSTLTAVQARREQKIVFRPGRTFPAFELTDVDGRPVRSVEFGGHPILVSFWRTWCAPCRKDFPRLDVIADKWRGSGLIVLALSDEEVDSQRRFRDSIGTRVRLVRVDESAPDDFDRVVVFPTSVLIDGRGAVRAEWKGELDVSEFGRAFADLATQSPQ